MGVLDIIGPIMIGPSSSHTAGAARLGNMARTILGEEPVKATIQLYGSFAQTYKGHGTDKALVAGLMGLSPEDPAIKTALDRAARSALQVVFTREESQDCHPNTVKFLLEGQSGRTVAVTGASTGGGRIVISKIDGYEVECTGEYYTLIAVYQDKPGVVAAVTKILAQHEVNIAFMKVSRKQKGAQALMILEADQPLTEEVIAAVNGLPAMESALLVKPLVGR